jgi:hypothetical protein
VKWFGAIFAATLLVCSEQTQEKYKHTYPHAKATQGMLSQVAALQANYMPQ